MRRIPFKNFAIQMSTRLSSLEATCRSTAGLPPDAWFDGARLRYTLFASPTSGTLLDAETVLDAVRHGMAGQDVARSVSVCV